MYNVVPFAGGVSFISYVSSSASALTACCSAISTFPLFIINSKNLSCILTKVFVVTVPVVSNDIFNVISPFWIVFIWLIFFPVESWINSPFTPRVDVLLVFISYPFFTNSFIIAVFIVSSLVASWLSALFARISNNFKLTISLA